MKKVCRNQACPTKDFEVETEKRMCISCGNLLQDTGLGNLLGDLFEGKF